MYAGDAVEDEGRGKRLNAKIWIVIVLTFGLIVQIHHLAIQRRPAASTGQNRRSWRFRGY